MQIQKVEEEMEVILFDRSKKPVEPTAIGIKLIQQAQTILQEFSRLEEIVQSERGEIEGKFSLGVIPTLAPYLLPIFLEEFVRQYPKVHLSKSWRVRYFTNPSSYTCPPGILCIRTKMSPPGI
jgi:LysR family hydrogen peroxide-inducible transcriptional activator